MYSLKFCPLLLLLAQLWLAKIGRGEEDNVGGEGNGLEEGSAAFCKEFAHLYMCQLRQQLGQIGQILDLAIGEIDFLAGSGGGGGNGPIGQVPSSEDLIDPSLEKRSVGVRSLAGAPLLVRLANRAGGGSKSSRGVKIRTSGPGLFLGGPLRQSPPGQPRTSTYRLIRLPIGTNRHSLAASGRTSLAGMGGGGGGQQQQNQPNQLLRQLWA